MAHGGSQARGQIGALAAGLRQSHSNSSCVCDLYHGEFMVALDPQPTEQDQGSNLQPHGS